MNKLLVMWSVKGKLKNIEEEKRISLTVGRIEIVVL
jgi:hypothetical protein